MMEFVSFQNRRKRRDFSFPMNTRRLSHVTNPSIVSAISRTMTGSLDLLPQSPKQRPTHTVNQARNAPIRKENALEREKLYQKMPKRKDGVIRKGDANAIKCEAIEE